MPSAATRSRIRDVLNGSSLTKANRVVRCQAFVHAACGDDPARRPRRGVHQFGAG